MRVNASTGRVGAQARARAHAQPAQACSASFCSRPTRPRTTRRQGARACTRHRPARTPAATRRGVSRRQSDARPPAVLAVHATAQSRTARTHALPRSSAERPRLSPGKAIPCGGAAPPGAMFCGRHISYVLGVRRHPALCFEGAAPLGAMFWGVREITLHIHRPAPATCPPGAARHPRSARTKRYLDDKEQGRERREHQRRRRRSPHANGQKFVGC